MSDKDVKAANEATVAKEAQKAADYAAGNRGLEKASGALGTDEVQRQVDEDEAKGYHGVKTDPLPNSAYSLEGGPPTAGTDAQPEPEK
jgi:hypothetical protein